MHDPKVVVFDIHLPVPRRAWKVSSAQARWEFKRIRFTDKPDVAVYPWFRPCAYQLHLAGRVIRLREFATIWHNEPGGHDSGHVCGRLPSGSSLTWKNVRWAWKHRAHLSVQLQWWQAWCRRRYQRCEHCSGRSTKTNPVNHSHSWADRSGKWNESKPGLYHSSCSSVVSLRHQLDHTQHELTQAQRALVDGKVNALWLETQGWPSTDAWTVMYRAESAAAAAREVAAP